MNIVDKIEQYGLQDHIEVVQSVYSGEWRPFEKARIFVRGLGVKNKKEWEIWVKIDARPDDIPSAPSKAYKDSGWVSWGDWLGTGNVRSKEWRPFEKARTFVQSLDLKGQAEWREYSKSGNRPDDIPSTPHKVYKDQGWVSWGDWLGSRHRKGGWRLFEEAKGFAQGLGLKGCKEWNVFAKSNSRPDDIPSSPNRVYKDQGWQGIRDWLGTA